MTEPTQHSGIGAYDNLRKHHCRYDTRTGALEITGMRIPLFCNSDQMKSALNEAVGFLNNDTPFLIVGENGTGKGLFAQAVHHLSDYYTTPFIRVDCATADDTIVRSGLFDHIVGFFGMPHGTIFLDEIAYLDAVFQNTLEGVIRTRKYQRLGDLQRPIMETNVQLIASTNNDLEGGISDGLSSSLKRIVIPPLRERKWDIYPLACYFLDLYGKRMGKEVSLSERARNELYSYDFPGNIKELEILVQKAVTETPNREECETFNLLVPQISVPLQPLSLKRLLEPQERAIIEATLQRYKWHQTKTAEALGIDRSTLYQKMKKYGLLKT